MKAIWNILAVMAIVNLLALVGGIAWLKSTDRLSKDRITAVRAAFVKTVAEEQAEKAAAEDDAKRKSAEKAQAEKMAQPPITASEKIAEQRLQEDQRLQVLLRQQQELENLRSGLMAQVAKLEEREKKLESDKKAFAVERKKIADTDGEKQFQVALSTLEGQKAKDAEQVLKAMLDQKQTEQVVAYLAKMEDGKRSKVMAEFVKDGPAMAADLLERLRTRGIVVPPSGALAQATAHDSTGSTAANGGGANGPSGPAR